MRLGIRRALVYAEGATREEARRQIARIEASCAPYSRSVQQRIEELQKLLVREEIPQEEDAWAILRARRGLKH